jgi:16S rRNA processing protein RimM
MNTIPCHRAGRISKTFGNKGQVIVILETDDKLTSDEPVFLIIDGKPVPFFVKTAEEKSYREWLIEFEDVDNPAIARRLCGLDVALLHLSLNSDEQEDDSFLHGYTVNDIHKGVLGKVYEIMKLPMHDLLVIRQEQRELLIPLSDAIIVKIYPRKKQIDINAPDGLLELNE